MGRYQIKKEMQPSEIYVTAAMLWTFTVDENIIATMKMRNNFCYLFLYCSSFSYLSSNSAITKVFALNLFASIFV